MVLQSLDTNETCLWQHWAQRNTIHIVLCSNTSTAGIIYHNIEFHRGGSLSMTITQKGLIIAHFQNPSPDFNKMSTFFQCVRALFPERAHKCSDVTAVVGVTVVSHLGFISAMDKVIIVEFSWRGHLGDGFMCLARHQRVTSLPEWQTQIKTNSLSYTRELSFSAGRGWCGLLLCVVTVLSTGQCSAGLATAACESCRVEKQIKAWLIVLHPAPTMQAKGMMGRWKVPFQGSGKVGKCHFRMERPGT